MRWRSKFQGDGAFLETIAGVRKAILYGNSAELQLEAVPNLRDLHCACHERVELPKVESGSRHASNFPGSCWAALPAGQEAPHEQILVSARWEFMEKVKSKLFLIGCSHAVSSLQYRFLHVSS